MLIKSSQIDSRDYSTTIKNWCKFDAMQCFWRQYSNDEEIAITLHGLEHDKSLLSLAHRMIDRYRMQNYEKGNKHRNACNCARIEKENGVQL